MTSVKQPAGKVTGAITIIGGLGGLLYASMLGVSLPVEVVAIFSATIGAAATLMFTNVD